MHKAKQVLVRLLAEAEAAKGEEKAARAEERAALKAAAGGGAAASAVVRVMVEAVNADAKNDVTGVASISLDEVVGASGCRVPVTVPAGAVVQVNFTTAECPELAIERYASEYPPETICEPLKLNSPFQCARNVEVPATTRLSLSVAAAQAVFAVSGIILVALLRKLSKPAETSSGDDELRSVVRKLRITVDKLSTGQDQLRTGQDQLRTGHGEHEELIQKLLSK